MTRLLLTQISPRGQGALLVLLLLLAVLVVAVVLALLRRRFVRPMTRAPSDTTDAWAEAGRRLGQPPRGADSPGEDPP